MPELRPSRFNHLAKVPGEDAWALYNFATGRLDVLDASRKESFDRAPEPSASSPEAAAWARAGFLTSADELAAVRAVAAAHARAAACGRVEQPLCFTVAVTHACNMACPYCFQTRGGAAMTAEVQDALVHLAAWRLEHGRHDRLEVVWFGGEPLLAVDAIERMSEQLAALAAHYGIPYSAIIVTNGYLLDQAMAERLERVGVRHATVSVDGDEEMHNASRPLAGGGPTYARIMGNLASLRTGMAVSVRCNVHAGNAGCLRELAERVREMSERTGTRMRLSPVRVKEAPANDGRPGMVDVLTPEEFDDALAAAGIARKRRSPLPSPAPCLAVQLGGLYVDANGEVFPQCNVMAADANFGLGNVVQWGGRLPHNWEEIAQRTIGELFFPEDSPKCLACKLLPCCWGRCPEKRLRTGEAACPPEFANPDALVLGLVAERKG